MAPVGEKGRDRENGAGKWANLAEIALLVRRIGWRCRGRRGEIGLGNHLSWLAYF